MAVAGSCEPPLAMVLKSQRLKGARFARHYTHPLTSMRQRRWQKWDLLSYVTSLHFNCAPSECSTDFPAYSDTVYSDTPLTVTVLTLRKLYFAKIQISHFSCS